MSKRNQKRIEHELKDLINERSNANKCGECGAGFPTWASVNLGIFLCGRCASLHRKLGPDVSIVKSLSLDKWNEEDLDQLSRIGNKKAKQFWNPKKVPFPFDDDDKDEIYQHLRQKYLQGKFRYDEIDELDYNLGGSTSRPRSRARSVSRPSSRPSTSSRNIPRLTHREISEYDRLKYRKQEKRLEDQGFLNIDDNYESLYLAKGDFNLAIDILQNSGPPTSSRDEGPKPALPRRPGTSVSSTNGVSAGQSISQPATASTDWWSGNNNGSTTQQSATPAIFDGTSTSNVASQQPTGLIEPPQQYLDPQTGIIYVDPVQQEQYLQQQQQLQMQQNPTGFFQQQSQQQPQQTGIFQQQQPQQTGFQQPQQTGIFFNQQQQQPFQTGGMAPQRTGVDKNQLLSLYNTGSQPQQQQQQQPQQTGFQQGFPQQQTGFQQPQQGYQFGGGFNGYGYQ